MASVGELIKQCRQYEERIRDLERRLAEKDETIEDLRSKLHRFRSVAGTYRLSGGSTSSGIGASPVRTAVAAVDEPRKTRAQGISAEPQAALSLTDLGKEPFKVHPKHEITKSFLQKAIQENDFLRNLSPTNIRDIVDCMFSVEYKRDTVIIKEGDAGSRLYVAEDGKLEVTKDSVKLNTMGPGEVFGELAILYNCKRTASVRALTQCKLWVVERSVFQGILMRTELLKQKEYIELLRRVPRFQKESDEVLAKIADLLEETHFENGEYITRQGCSGDTFYVILKGKVRQTKKGATGEEVRLLGRGEYFGEGALDGAEVRDSSIIAADMQGVDCILLERELLTQVIGKQDTNRRSVQSNDEDKGEMFVSA